MKTFVMEGVVRCVAWCPNASLALLAAAVDRNVHLLAPGVGDRLVQARTDELLKEAPQSSDYLGTITFPHPYKYFHFYFSCCLCYL